MKKYKIELKWGIIFFLAGLIWMYIEKAMGWHGDKIEQHAIFTWIFAIVAFLLYYFALKEKRDDYYEGFMTWKQGFVSGMIISVIIAILSPVSQYIVHTIISPEYLDNLIAMGVEKGKGTEEELAKFSNLKSYIIMSFFSAIVMGAVTSAIIALITKRTKKETT